LLRVCQSGNARLECVTVENFRPFCLSRPWLLPLLRKKRKEHEYQVTAYLIANPTFSPSPSPSPEHPRIHTRHSLSSAHIFSFSFLFAVGGFLTERGIAVATGQKGPWIFGRRSF